MIRFLKDEDGQGMLEYVLIIALVALVAVVALVVVKTFLGNKNSDISNQLSNAESTTAT